MNEIPPIVVGYDRTGGSKRAADWAAAEAKALRAPLRLVYAMPTEDTFGLLARHGRIATREPDLLRAAAHRLVAAGAWAAAAAAGGMPVSTATYDTDAVSALLDAATGARMLVLGSRRLGPVGSVLLGSTGAAVATRAPCPLVIVRGLAGLAAERAEVVLGVDPLHEAAPAVDFAFDFASRHGAPLRAVMCWSPDRLAETPWHRPRSVPTEARALLSQVLSGHRERYPDVELHPVVIRANPVDALVSESAAGRLLVVGARGRRAVTGALLGSVSRGVLHRATCPVAVIGTRRGAP